MKFRHNWLNCIAKFEEVYRSDPDGAWAPAGLYMQGALYLKLYERSYLPSDRKEAIDIFHRIGKRFPTSAYRKKADSALAGLLKPDESPPRPEAAGSDGASAKDLYMRADACYRDLRNNPRLQKYRDRWMRCIEGFEAVYRTDPSGPWASAGLYMSGVLYEGLSRRSFRQADAEKALDRFRRVAETYPESRYRQKALADIERMTDSGVPGEAVDDNGVDSLIASQPSDADDTDPSSGPPPPSASDSDPSGRILVSGLRYWSNPNYTRVVVDADGDTGFTHRLLKKDPSIGKPPRLFVDLTGAVLDKDLDKLVPINDNLLSDIRAGQYTQDTVRVVIDIKSFKTYKIFSLRNPFRIVIDVWGESAEVASASPQKGSNAAELPANALAKQFALGVSRIVIDPGHGGRDYGAPGYLKGVHEKDVVLRIALRLEKQIRSELGCEVILTRRDDRYLTLEERTAIANTQNADLFISIHTNSHRDRRAYGIETYFLNLATDNESIMVAATENATSEKNISDLQTILLDLMQNAKINESSRLATHVQKEIYGRLKSRYSLIRDKGVKQAPFYVLLGAQMPAVLVETSFISNARECKRLVSPDYQEQLCRGIVDGIRSYIRENQPTAFRRPVTGSQGG
ncbi:MAG: N-acetylmuramoyl-L-alanine amidase [Desulfobacterales bacterium]